MPRPMTKGESDAQLAAARIQARWQIQNPPPVFTSNLRANKAAWMEYTARWKESDDYQRCRAVMAAHKGGQRSNPLA